MKEKQGVPSAAARTSTSAHVPKHSTPRAQATTKHPRRSFHLFLLHTGICLHFRLNLHIQCGVAVVHRQVHK